jgi:hypothetical protein
MNRDKGAYMNYVCPYCWNTLDKCSCSLFPPYSLVFVDKNIQEHIRILNNKGYCTSGCCEGHTEVCISTYITFCDEYFGEDLVLPEGFFYNKKKRMVYHGYKVNQLTSKEFEMEKRKKLTALLRWCKGLPIHI